MSDRAMTLSVAVHDPEVIVAQEVQRNSGQTTTIVELGRKVDGSLGPSTVTLFLNASSVLPFVVGLVKALDDASPAFLLELLDELTG